MESNPDSSTKPVFEVSEASLTDDPDYWRQVCERYRRKGFRIVLNCALTCGTARPVSVAMLIGLWPDYIKLDKTLVGGIEKLPCATAIRRLADLGARFGIPVVADGVDRRMTMENLWLLNISLMQGRLWDTAAEIQQPEFRLGYWPSLLTPPSRTSKASDRHARRCWPRRVSSA
jgi:EAL domain-containing protein (putative c-di-GMP-specific phosphodiesterase class I)